MGTGSCVLAGTRESEALAFSSACHGAGRAMSRHQASRNWKGREVVDALAARGILVRSPSMRGIAEEAPEAYKDVTAVVDAAGLARKVARVEPLICIKGQASPSYVLVNVASGGACTPPPEELSTGMCVLQRVEVRYWIVICFGFDFCVSVFGRCTVSTPSLSSQRMASTLMSSGNAKLRVKLP